MRRLAVFALTVLLSAIIPCRAVAQKVHRISILAADDLFLQSIEGFKQRMTLLGYVEGKNIAYNFQNSNGSQEWLHRLAEDAVQQKPDLIVTASTTATIPVAKLTQGTALPVVFLAGNPFRFVKSYASSGNNLTGISSSVYDLAGKQVELIRGILPRAKKIAVLVNVNRPDHREYIEKSREAAEKIGLAVSAADMQSDNVEDVIQQLARINRKLGDGLLIAPDSAFASAIGEITQQAIREKIPCFGRYVEAAQNGSVAAYISDNKSIGQQGALLADKILKGAKPLDLPIEQPNKLKLVINLKVAKAFKLEIPKDLLLQADELVK